MTKLRKVVSLLLVILLATVGVSGCGNHEHTAPQRNTVRLASVSTTESQIISNILAQLIEHDTNLHFKIIGNLGSSSVEHKALQRGDADILATSYTGTDLTGTLGEKPEKNPKIATRIVDRDLAKRYNEIRFPSFGFADTYAFMVGPKLAQKYHLRDVSDLKPVAKKLNAGVDSSWLTRKGDGYKEFTHVYEFDFKKVSPMQIGLVYDALNKGKMQVVLGYSTDGRIRSYHLHVLKDNKHFFPPYEAAPVATRAVLKRYPQLKPTLHKLDGRISLQQMQHLNYEVDDKLLEPSVVAHHFLVQHHYFDRR